MDWDCRLDCGFDAPRAPQGAGRPGDDGRRHARRWTWRGSRLTLDTTNSRSDGPAGHALGPGPGPPSCVRPPRTTCACSMLASGGRSAADNGATRRPARSVGARVSFGSILPVYPHGPSRIADGVVVLADEPTVVCLNVPYRPGTNQRSLPHAAELNTCSVRACSRSLSSFTL